MCKSSGPKYATELDFEEKWTNFVLWTRWRWWNYFGGFAYDKFRTCVFNWSFYVALSGLIGRVGGGRGLRFVRVVTGFVWNLWDRNSLFFHSFFFSLFFLLSFLVFPLFIYSYFVLFSLPPFIFSVFSFFFRSFSLFHPLNNFTLSLQFL